MIRRMGFALWMTLVVCLAQAASSGDVFEGADWISPASFVRATNATIEVRCPFVARTGGTAELAVSADAVYAVRLNGRTLVASARLPDVPPVRFYDVWKVEGVRAGTNELAFGATCIRSRRANTVSSARRLQGREVTPGSDASVSS